jgi:hypothetical protein
LRVLLVKPRHLAAHFGLAPFFRTEPLGLEHIAAALGAHGHQVRIVDMCFECSSMAKIIRSQQLMNPRAYLAECSIPFDAE